MKKIIILALIVLFSCSSEEEVSNTKEALGLFEVEVNQKKITFDIIKIDFSSTPVIIGKNDFGDVFNVDLFPNDTVTPTIYSGSINGAEFSHFFRPINIENHYINFNVIEKTDNSTIIEFEGEVGAVKGETDVLKFENGIIDISY